MKTITPIGAAVVGVVHAVNQAVFGLCVNTFMGKAGVSVGIPLNDFFRVNLLVLVQAHAKGFIAGKVLQNIHVVGECHRVVWLVGNPVVPGRLTQFTSW